jgi:hypothetical protein
LSLFGGGRSSYLRRRLTYPRCGSGSAIGAAAAIAARAAATIVNFIFIFVLGMSDLKRMFKGMDKLKPVWNQKTLLSTRTKRYFYMSRFLVWGLIRSWMMYIRL